MSLGYIGKAKKMDEDEKYVIYLYSGENWNDKNSESGDVDLLDGEILINKKCLEEPIIHTKIKKKKIYEKRIVHTVNIQKYIDDGEIVIQKKCKNEFHRSGYSEIDYFAYMLLNKIFEEYQKVGELLEEVSFIQ